MAFHLYKGRINLIRGSTLIILIKIQWEYLFMMITESPCRIKAAPRWYSVSRNIRIFTPYRSLSEMTGQLTVLFNTFIIIFTLQRLFYIKIRMSVKPETASKRRKHLPCCKFCLCKLNLNTKWCFLFLYLFFPPQKTFPRNYNLFFSSFLRKYYRNCKHCQ